MCIRDRLQRAGRVEVPTPDQRVIDRIEADLRVQHVDGSHRRRTFAGWPRRAILGVVASALVVAGGFGVTRVLADRSEQVPLEVAGEPTQSDTGVGDASGPVDESPASTVFESPTATPTPTPDAAVTGTQSVEPEAPVPLPSVTPSPTTDASVVAEPTASATEPRPSATTVPAPPDPAGQTATPQPVTPAPSVAPTSVAQSDPTPVPVTPVPIPAVVATSTPVPTATPTPTPPPTPTPTATPLPPIEASCGARIGREAVGVVCEWVPIEADVDAYRVLRIRNGAARQRVGELATDESMWIDRNVRRGYTLVYAIAALSDGEIITESTPIVITISNESG